MQELDVQKLGFSDADGVPYVIEGDDMDPEMLEAYEQFAAENEHFHPSWSSQPSLVDSPQTLMYSLWTAFLVSVIWCA